MFISIFGRRRPGAWQRADDQISELPQTPADTHDTTRHLLNVAGGLALVLSRCNAREVEREYPNAAELYRLLRHDLKRYGRTSATADLMLETLHEVSERLDPVSRQSLRASLEARRSHDRRKETLPGAIAATPAAVQAHIHDRQDVRELGCEVIESDADGGQAFAEPSAA
jgi:hypothetical protein